MADVVAGIGWYEKSQWPDYRRMMSDSVEERYEDWLKQALKAETQLKRRGVRVIRVAIDLGLFDLWCTKNNFARDSSARANFANYMVGKIDQAESN